MHIFSGLHKLQVLTLEYNQLTELQPIFNDLTNLKALDISTNNIKALEGKVFESLPALKYINIRYNGISEISKNSFEGLGNNTYVAVDSHGICCFIAAHQGRCFPLHVDSKSEYLTCNQLLANKWIRSSMWILGISMLLLNVGVIVYGCLELCNRHKYPDKLPQVILITNLAFADFIMGIYMIIIAIADLSFGHHFPLLAEQWRNSLACKAAGFLAILSSEASLLFLTLISIERLSAFIWLKQRIFPRRRHRVMVVVAAWILAIILSSIPTAIRNENQYFYDVSEVCIGLPLARDVSHQTIAQTFNITYEAIDRKPDPLHFQNISYSNTTVGPLYSTGLFLGFNLLCCFILVFCYISIFLIVIYIGHRYKIRMNTNHLTRFKMQLRFFMELQMTLKIGLVVLTDLLCWMPIIYLGILVQMDKKTIPPDIFAWFVAFVLPINSVTNPLIYGMWHIIARRRRWNILTRRKEIAYRRLRETRL